jgi:hypothetical protein
VSTTLSATGHVSKSFARVTGVNHGLASVDSLGSIAVAGKAMRLIARAGANVNSKIGELLHAKSVI